MANPNANQSGTNKSGNSQQSASQGKPGSQQQNSGNFANDRAKASAAGQKGGQNSHGGR